MCDTFTRSYISLLNNGKEDDAYKLLHKEYYCLLFRFASAFLKSREPAEELVNDLLYKIWMKREAVSEINNLKVYLMASIRNMCLTILSRQKKEQELIQKMGSENSISLADDPESLYITNELQKVIKDAIASLPPRCKQIYEMVRIERLRNKDVAVKLNISVNTIDVQLAIALKKLVQSVNAFNQRNNSKKIGWK